MKRTILIIDDDDMLRNTLARGLRGNDFNVVTAGSAEEGDDILNKVKFDAIVLDRMMTGMDGLSFLKKIRAGGDTTPVIMLTAMVGAENAIDGLIGGANDYLAKPFQLRELILRLGNIIKNIDVPDEKLPIGLIFNDDEFFVMDKSQPKLLSLSGEEKRLLTQMLRPMGNTAPAAPMVAKRLRMKLNSVLSNIDVITVRGKGYKLVYSH